MTDTYTRNNFKFDGITISIDHNRNNDLTDFAMTTLEDRYLLPGETPQHMFARVATYYGSSNEHAQRLYDAISTRKFMPSTPILSNGGTERGLPISCFLNEAQDSMDSIRDVWSENATLAAYGGGIGTSWRKVRSIGEPVADVGETSGIIPFLKVQDSMTMAVSQGALRRGSSAAYLDISHPEIEAFIDVRRPNKGDERRRCMDIHHGIMVTDEFMRAVVGGDDFDLKSPKTKEVVKTVSARDIWQKILEARMDTGEPYLVFEDHVRKATPEHHKKLNLYPSQSNLCSEITLPTSSDRTAVCCLASLNLAEVDLQDPYEDHTELVEDILRMLDNVLTDFEDQAEGDPEMWKAVRSVRHERSVGLGVAGFHSYLQKHNIPFESDEAAESNAEVFLAFQYLVDAANQKLALELGPCKDWVKTLRYIEAPISAPVRFSYASAIAPTASISIIMGEVSAGVEPLPANIFTHKTLSGSFTVKNKYLNDLIVTKLVAKGESTYAEDYEAVWSEIIAKEGSVQDLKTIDLSDEEKAIFKTAFEIDQLYLIRMMAQRAPNVDQAVSNNIFVKPGTTRKDLHDLHMLAWSSGVKSLYYCRTLAADRAATIKTHEAGEMPQPDQTEVPEDNSRDGEECLVCQ